MLTVTDWATLEHAYGNAQDVPALLTAADHASDEVGVEWDELWSRLCHQGTVYSASYAALPVLATIAGRHAPSGYVAALHLAAAIIASEDGPQRAADVRRDHADDLAQLRDLAETNLALARDDTEFIYGLQASCPSRTAVPGSDASTTWPMARCPWTVPPAARRSCSTSQAKTSHWRTTTTRRFRSRR